MFGNPSFKSAVLWNLMPRIILPHPVALKTGLSKIYCIFSHICDIFVTCEIQLKNKHDNYYYILPLASIMENWRTFTSTISVGCFFSSDLFVSSSKSISLQIGYKASQWLHCTNVSVKARVQRTINDILIYCCLTVTVRQLPFLKKILNKVDTAKLDLSPKLKKKADWN